MRLVQISYGSTEAKDCLILGLAHLSVIDSAAPHNIPRSSTHISHIIMCWNSAEWVVSVVSHLQMEKKKKKKCGETCSDRQQLLPPRRYRFHSVVKWSFENPGAGTESGCFLLSLSFFFIFWLPSLVWIADGKHFRRFRQERAYRLCQMSAWCRAARAAGK